MSAAGKATDDNVLDHVETPQIDTTPPPDTKVETLREEIARQVRDPRPRDDQGRFKEAGEDTPAGEQPRGARKTLTLPAGQKADAPGVNGDKAASAPDTGKVSSTPAPDPNATPPTPAIKAPDFLKADVKAKWGELAPWAQAAWAAREAEIHRQMTAHDEDRQFGKYARESSAPYAESFRQFGGDVRQGWENYMKWATVMLRGSNDDKISALRSIAQAYNVQLGGPLQAAPQDPRYAQLEQQVAELRQGRQADLQAQERAVNDRINAEVEDFKAQPGHEHFDTVRKLMGVYVNGGVTTDLQEAYDMAVRAHPEVHALAAAAQAQAGETARAAAEAERVRKAKAAGVSVSGAPGGGGPIVTNGSGAKLSLRDELRANLAAATGGGRV